MITAEQMRAARAMLKIEQATLAEKAGVSIETIKRFEAMKGPIKGREDTVASIQSALEMAGIKFTSGSGSSGVEVIDDPTVPIKDMLADTAKNITLAILNSAQSADKSLFQRGPSHIFMVLKNGIDQWIDFQLAEVSKSSREKRAERRAKRAYRRPAPGMSPLDEDDQESTHYAPEFSRAKRHHIPLDLSIFTSDATTKDE